MKGGKKDRRYPLLAFAMFVLAAGAAFAHQPRLVDDRPSIIVRNPGRYGTWRVNRLTTRVGPPRK